MVEAEEEEQKENGGGGGGGGGGTQKIRHLRTTSIRHIEVRDVAG